MKYSPMIVTAYYKQLGLPEPVFEYVFHPKRKWRLDIAWPEKKIAIEVEGGIYQRLPSHSSITGIRRDMEKHNALTLMGWKVLRIEPKEVCMLNTVGMVTELMG